MGILDIIRKICVKFIGVILSNKSIKGIVGANAIDIIAKFLGEDKAKKIKKIISLIKEVLGK